MIKVPHVFEIQRLIPKLSISLNKLVLLACLLVIIYFGVQKYKLHITEQAEASVYILNPQVNDIYFLDLSHLKDQLKQKNKYKLAKVVRISDDIVTIVYGHFFYQWQYSVVNSIQYGDLSNKGYFDQIPEYISFSTIKEMKSNGTIYLVKRPKQHKIYGSLVSPE